MAIADRGAFLCTVENVSLVKCVPSISCVPGGVIVGDSGLCCVPVIFILLNVLRCQGDQGVPVNVIVSVI